jgi:sugar (pentulose or hexulose) kinase
MKCLALDIGSSTIKGAVVDVERRALGHITARPFPPAIAGLPPRHFEVDPHAIEAAVREVLHSLLVVAPEARRLYVASQMGGVILLGAGGQPLSNYLSWRDQRTLEESAQSDSLLVRLRERLAGELYDTLGNELQPGSTPALLAWLSEAGTLPTNATPLTVADYVIARLCGAPGTMHVTHAVSMLDLRSCDWHHDALVTLGLANVPLPRLQRGLEPVGVFQVGGRTVDVFGAFGDQQCALLGAGLERDELSINISTGSQVSRRVDQLETGQFQTRAYFGGELLRTITHLPAGRSLSVLVDLLTELAVAEGVTLRDPWGTIARLTDQTATKNDASGLVCDLSYFVGPFGASGSITGITTENLTVGNLFLAALYSMADNYARCAERIDQERTCRQVVLSGSLARTSVVLRSAIEQRLELPLRDTAGEEETLLGLLRLAEWGDSHSQPKTYEDNTRSRAS